MLIAFNVLYSCCFVFSFFFFSVTAPTEIYTLSLHDALPIYREEQDTDRGREAEPDPRRDVHTVYRDRGGGRSEEHTSELQSQFHLVCRLLLEKKKDNNRILEAKLHHRRVGNGAITLASIRIH